MAIGLQVWSKTAASNSNADTNINWAEGMAPSQVNDSARAEMASVALWRDDNNGTIVTAGSSTAYTATSNQIAGSLTAGYTIAVQFHATSDAGATLAVDSLTAKPLQVVAGSNLVGGEFSIGNIARFTYSTTGTGQWIANNVIRNKTLTSSLSTNVTINSTGSFFDGPSVAQGTNGTWLAMGTVTLVDTAGNQTFFAKLWDGTSVIASVAGRASGTNDLALSLSGVITSPAANIKISVQETGTNGLIIANDTGAAKDSTLTVVRII